MRTGPPKLHHLNASQFLLCLFEHYHEGALMTDHTGILVYYNQFQARLDGLDRRQVLGRPVTEVYRLEPHLSTTMMAIRASRPVINRPHVYHTMDGKLVNSLESAYPIFDYDEIIGAVCVVSDYSSLAGNLPLETPSPPRPSTPPGRPEAISFADLVGKDENLLTAVDVARKAASTPSSVMLTGETGTGKELFARAIHNESPRRQGPFMAINCAAIPAGLLEGLLFGTSKGAFTGAVDKAGLLEMADQGTLFLDELNAMPLDLQPKLLRVLQDRRVRRVGSGLETPISVKIVSAVNDSPFQAMREGRLRSDLFYRLGVVMVHLPPLRERRDDIPLLLQHFVRKYNSILGRKARRFSPEALARLEGYRWPGNVREMEHAVESVLNLLDGEETVISFERLKTALPLLNFRSEARGEAENRGPASGGAGRTALPDAGRADEAAQIARLLRLCRGNVSQAARLLDFSPQRLHYRLKKLGLRSGDFKYSPLN